MWWHDHRPTVARFAGLASALALGCLVAGCFEPLYGEKTLAGGPGLRQRLSSVSIDRIPAPSGTLAARIAVEVQNDLSFDLTGGSGHLPKTHQLKIALTTQNQQVIVDITTARADVQQFGINASYTLIESATGKPVMTGSTSARVSYDNPGQQQRFANARGQRDAENRAAKLIADNIKSRLASYFVAGT
jgi:LPS-assembly lipoprotein